MSTRTVDTTRDVRSDGERTLAVALGLVRRTPPPVPVPSPTQRIVPGRSPLEASGWTEPSERDRAHR